LKHFQRVSIKGGEKMHSITGKMSYINSFNTINGECTHAYITVYHTTLPELKQRVKIVAWRKVGDKLKTMRKGQLIAVNFEQHGTETFKGQTIQKVKAMEVSRSSSRELQVLFMNEDGQYDPFGWGEKKNAK